MDRKFASLIVAALTALAMILGIAQPSFAITPVGSADAVAADILTLAGSNSSSLAPSLNDLLLTPETNGVKPVQRGGLTIWPNAQPNVSYAARSVPGGTQQFVDIASAKAPTAYPFHLKPGFHAKAGPNGGAVIYDSSQRPVRAVPMPWAKDARGKLVPAHFSFSSDGKTLTKIVEHRQAGVAYPVVADPIMIWIAIMGAIVLTKCVVNGTKEAVALKGRKWYIVMWNVGWVCATDW
jgi:hypothetical protein